MDTITEDWFLTYGDFSGPAYQARSEYAQFTSDDHYDIFMTEEGITAPVPPKGLVERFCTICDVKNHKAHMVLQAILGLADLVDARTMIRGEEYGLDDDEEDELVVLGEGGGSTAAVGSSTISKGGYLTR